jgi:hypothetical protein
MKVKLPIAAIPIVVMITLFGLLAMGCEQFQPITYENKTSVTIQVFLDIVPLSYNGTPTRTWNQFGNIELEVGESKKLLTEVSPTKGTVEWRKYTIVAVTETNKIIYSKIFIWDELHDANWKIVIQ